MRAHLIFLFFWKQTFHDTSGISVHCVRFDYIDPDQEQWFYYVRGSSCSGVYKYGFYVGTDNETDRYISGTSFGGDPGYDNNYYWIHFKPEKEGDIWKSCERIYTRFTNLFYRPG